MDEPKDDQNWQPGDVAEATCPMFLAGDPMRGQFVAPGDRFVVLAVTEEQWRGRALICLRLTGVKHPCLASVFRKIIPTFEEPKVSDMVAL